MRHTTAVIIGAGQAGLAMSRCLSDLGIEHVVLERGKVAERWRRQSWDSLHLLTPNWMTRLPGFQYRRKRAGRLHVGPWAGHVPGALRGLIRSAGDRRHDRSTR